MKQNKPRKKSTTSLIKKHIVFPAEPKQLAGVRQIIGELWRKQNLPQKEGYLVALAVDEALSSIIRHAKGMKRAGNVNIELHIDDVCFKAIIQDNTNAFDFNKLSERDKKITLDKERQYQLGIFLISVIMDEIIYHYHKGFQNELQLTRFITR